MYRVIIDVDQYLQNPRLAELGSCRTYSLEFSNTHVDRN
jgi:hypothetical protein